MTTAAVDSTPRDKSPRSRKLNSDSFLSRAQELVTENFNAHRKTSKIPELNRTDVHIVWFAKILGGWKCIIASTVAKGLLWEVTYASARDEIYLDVYSKVNNIKISLGEDSEPDETSRAV
jgi:hypothetical protein